MLASACVPPAVAQSIWQSGGVANTDYGEPTNWSNNTVPANPGDSASFSNAGSTTVVVGAPVTPDSWTFANNAQSYGISGAAVNFGGAGIVNNSAVGQTIGNVIGGSGGILQNGAGTLTINGNNTYTGGTTVASGTLQVGLFSNLGNTNNSVTVSGGTLNLGTVVTQDGGVTLTGGTIQGGTLSTTSTFDLQSGTVSANLVGQGQLIKNGPGTVTLSGTNDHTGGNVLNAGTLVLGTNAALGSSDLTINGGVLAYAAGINVLQNITLNATGVLQVASGTATQTGDIAEAVPTTQGIEKTGAGTLVLAGNNNFNGPVTISGGTLKMDTVLSGLSDVIIGAGTPSDTPTLDLNGNNIGVNGLSGQGRVTNSGNFDATLFVGTAGFTTASSTYGGVIQDGATNKTWLEVETSGVFTLTGANTYTGLTIICDCATLQIGNGGASGSIVSDVFNSNLLIFNRDGFYQFNNTISDGFSAGRVEKKGAGTLVLANAANSYTGGTIITEGVLQVVNPAALSTGPITLNGGTFQAGANNLTITNAFRVNTAGGTIDTQGRTMTIDAVISDGNGPGKLTVSASGAFGSGSLILTKNNTYTGGTVVGPGTLQLGNGGTQGGIVGDIELTRFNSTLAVNRSNLLTLNGVISGDGGVVQNGSGTLVLGGDNTYQGGTSINSGFVAVNHNNALGTGTVTIGNGARLRADVTDNLIIPNRITLGAGGGFVSSNGLTLTLTGTIDGAGALTKAGAGTLILTGELMHTGGTTINAGTLQISGGSGAFPFPGDIVDNATLEVDRTAFMRINGVISGTGNLIKDGSGTLVLAGNNSYQGGTEIKGGTLLLEHSNALGTGALTTTGSVVAYADGVDIANPIILNSNTTQLFSDEGVATQSGVISELNGPRPVEKTGERTLILTGANTYTGLTTVTAGTLQIGTAGTQGVMPGNAKVSSEGQLHFVNANLAAMATIDNEGAVLFFNSTTAGNTAITNKGQVAFNDNSTAGSANITSFGNPAAGFITGSVTFNNNSSAGNATITSPLFLDFFDNSSAGNATITVGSDATVQVADFSKLGTATITTSSTSFTFFGDASAENARITVSGGQVDFLGNTTAATSQITLNGGVLNFNETSTAGSAALTVNGGVLGFFGNSTAATSQITLTGGALNFNETSTAGTAAFTVNGGTLRFLDASDPGQASFTVGANGIVRFDGTTGPLGDNRITAGSIVSSGQLNTGANKLTVTNNVTFNPGSQWSLSITPTSGVRLVADSLTLNGGQVSITGSGQFTPGTYKFAETAGGNVTGQFTSVTGTFAGNVRNPHFIYGATFVDLVLDQGLISVLLPPGSGTNQSNVANALDNALIGGANLGPLEALFNLSPQGLLAALGQLSGQNSNGLSQAGFQAMGQFLNVMLDPFVDTRGGGTAAPLPFGPAAALPPEVAAAYAALMPVKAPPLGPRNPWTVWGAATGGYNKVSGSTPLGTADTTTRAYGFAAGADYRYGPNTIVGLSIAGGATSWGLSDGLGGGRSDALHLGAYASHRFSASGYVSAAIGYAHHWVTTDRTVTTPATAQLNANFGADVLGGRIESGYRMAMRAFGVTPYAAAQTVSIWSPAYAETATAGAGAFALTFASRNATTTRTELGSWFDISSLIGGGQVVTWRARAAWAHNWFSDPSMAATFLTLPSASFVVNGAAPARDTALLSAVAEFGLRKNMSLLAKVDGEFGAQTRTYTGMGVLRYLW